MASFGINMRVIFALPEAEGKKEAASACENFPRYFPAQPCWCFWADPSRHRRNRRTAPARPTAVPARPAAAPVRPPAAPSAAPAPRGGAACHNGMSFDRFLADLKQQAVAAGRVAAGAGGSGTLPRLRPEHRQPRPRPARVRAGVQRIRAEQGVRWCGKKCASANPDACGSVQPRREGIWGAAGGDRRVLGPGEQFWRRIGQAAHAAVAGVAGLRLPPLRDVPEGDHRRVEDHRSRRSHGKRDDRFVGWRTRPDAIFADALLQLRGRLRRRRPSQSPEQRARRDRLDRELHRQWTEMAARRTLAAGSARAAKSRRGTRPI